MRLIFLSIFRGLEPPLNWVKNKNNDWKHEKIYITSASALYMGHNYWPKNNDNNNNIFYF